MSEERGKDLGSKMSLLEKQGEKSDMFSSVSVKSDHSIGVPPQLSDKTPSSTKSVRSGSHVSSSVSMKSNRSIGLPPQLSDKTPSSTTSGRSGSHVSSSVSMKSDHSIGVPPQFSDKTPSSATRKKSFSRSASLESDHSKGGGPNSSERKTSFAKRERLGSVESSSVSMRSDSSKDGALPNFREKTTSIKSIKEQKTTVNIGAEIVRWKSLKNQKGMNSDVELASFLLNRIQCEKKTDFQSNRFKNFRENLTWVFQDLEHKIIVFLKNELERFKKILKKENTQYFVQDFMEDTCSIKDAALDITLHFLKIMKQDELADTLKDELVFIHQRQLKSNLKKKYQCVFEGIAKHGDFTLLNSIYTDLYITQGGSEQVNNEHEVRQIEKSRRAESQEIPIECTNLFESPEQDKEIRTVLTKGVAGIGKSISVQKFILDWAEGKENQDISFIFPLPFREMNLKEKENQSLMNLVSEFFPEVKGLNLTRNDKFKVLFILDGLDECRLPLNFGNETWRDVSSPASLDVLLTNLIKGNLLPSALIWITTRPAAACKIPPDCIKRVTEVRGFNDAQKEEYFRKRFTDEKMRKDIIDHVKKSKSLFIMCHIPVFCWISATVLQNILEEKRNNDVKNNQANNISKTLQESNTEDIPKTLTQMYTHFLRFQIQQSRRKYDGEYTPDVSWDKEAILSLGKLAFRQLERNNLIFYDTDLEACGIDVNKASVYSGMCTQIFKEETGIILGTMYCFVHMSIQEFIAALYAHLFLDINKKNVFDQESTEQRNKNEAMIDLLEAAVNKALESEIGHLDLFLRFLLGLSLESNRPLLQGLLTHQDSYAQSNEVIVQYIKQKLGENLSPERSINLFYCLNELNDQTLVKDIQTQLSKGSLSSADLSPAQWSALAFVLLTSEEELEDFELQKFKKSDECLIRLSEVIKTSKRALLNDCNLTDKSCSALATVLGSDTSLKELNMNNNNLHDSGVELLCTGLKSVKCKLETLWLSDCDLTEKSCSALASVLSSDSSSLKDLELSNNNLQDSGVMLLCDGLKNNSKLEKIRLSDCSITEEGYKALASALRSNPSHLIELDLTGNDPGQSGVKELSDLLQDQNCQLKTLRFLGPDAEKACKYLTEDLHIKNPLLQRELNLSGRELGDTRVKQISALLQDKHCTVNRLMLNNNSITAEGCAALTSAFNSNPSNLELDLSANNLGNSGIEEICPLLENTQCRLTKLKLSDCSITEEGYKALASALRSNPSHLIELDLTGNDPGQSGVKELDDLLQDEHCKLKISRFLKSPAAQEACDYLTKVLGESPLLLTELDLSEDKLGDLDGEKLSAFLMDSHSKVEKIKLNNCDLTEESCSVLATVLSSKTILKELNLNNSRLLDSGVKQICEGLKNPVCELKILNLSDCSITEEGYKALASALRSNPSHLIELDLTRNDPGQSGVKELDDLLQDQNCQLKTLRFLDPAADEACQYVRGIVGKNPLLLRELNLSKRELKDTRVHQIAALLQDKHCKLNTLKLCDCDLTEESCSALATVLTSNSSLKELDISNNNIMDSGVKKLQNALENTKCTLEKLRLSDCSITEEGYKALASALRSNPSHLIELDLTGNDPGQSGVKELSDLLQDQKCQLKTLRFLSRAADEACQFVNRVLGENLLLLRELNLSEHKLGPSGLKKLAAVLPDKHCKLNTLILNNSDITDEDCLVLTAALNSNPSNLTELNLSRTKLRDSGLKIFSALLKNEQCQLEKLKLNCSSITAEGCSVLASEFCLNLKELEVNENKLGDSGVTEISTLLGNSQCTLKILRLSDCSITEEGYKALASALRSNPSHLIELDLTGNDPGQSGVKELNDLLQDQNCQLKTLRFLGPAADEACQYVRGIVDENPLLLRELNLSGRKLGDTRVNQITALLRDKHCKLNTLKLSDCSIREEGYKALASALRSNPSHLIELDLTGNDPGQSGVKELNDLLQDQKCKLKTLRFLGPAADEACQYVRGIVSDNPLLLRELNLSKCELGDTRVHQIAALLQDKHCKLNTLILNNSDITAEGCRVLTEALNSNPSNLTELNLSGTKLRDSGVKIFSTLFENEQCRLEKLKFNCISITAEGCAALTKAFISNPSNLIELDLSANKLGDSGVTQISTLLENSQCTLKIIRLSDCSISEEGYKALASALRSNPSHLVELDLTGNDPGQSGVKEINYLLQDQNCKLKTLRFLDPDADEACQFVTGIVGKNPLLLRELNLCGRKLGDTRVNQFAALLKDKHCKINTLMLNNNSITAEGCAALTSAFNSNPSNLRELDLSGNKLGNSGMKKICPLLENTQCKMEKLKLSDCSIREEGYKALASALRSNPSHLIELDLTGNDPGQSGVKELSDLLQDDSCKLTIRFLKSPAAQEACDYLTEVLGESPLLRTELDLSEDKLGDLDGENLSALLMDSHNKVEKIKLNNCELTEESCSVLATVLSSKTILKELNLNNSCLLDSGVKQIFEGLKKSTLKILKLSDCSITEEGYKALASALRSNPSHLIELDLTGNDPGQSGVKELDDLLQDQKCQLKTLRLLQSPDAEKACKYLTEDLHNENPLLLRELNLSGHELGDTRVNQITALLQDKHCKLNTLMLHDCGLTEKSCSALATVLRSNSSLKELDISNNNLQDSGVKKLQNGLENTICTLEKLRLSDCSITEEGYKALASALRSNPSHLIELDLTGNDPGQSGVKELDDLLQDTKCQLKTLRFLGPAADEACQFVTGIVGKNLLLLRELNLSGRELGDTQVKQIAALLKDKHCKLNTLTLNNNSITAEGCAALTSAFNSNLIELDLSGNKLGNSGMEKICHLLKNTQCRLEKLKLSDCSISEEGYKALASALRSNPSHLIELDLTGNDPGQSGVKELNDLLQDERYTLKTIRFLKSPAAQEACDYLTKVLGESPLLRTELDLSEDILGDLDVEKLSALLMDSHSKVEKFKLNNCELTEKSCSVLATVLSSKTILKELNLNNSRLLDSGVKQICEGLKNPVCQLKILNLSDCSISEEGYKALASALRSNPSHLIELDLTGNDPGQSGVKELDDLLQDQKCKLKTLRFLSSAAEEACKYLTEDLHIKNPLLLRELNLSKHELGDTRVNQIAALLQDKHCKLNALILCGCRITENQCYTLTSALFPNLSHLRELDLSGNQIKHTGAKNISDVLKDSCCQLERLRLRNCGLTEESCSALATVLRSNSSLKELDISNNNLQDSGVKKLQNGLQNTNCTLEKLRLSGCCITEEGYKSLASALRSNLSHLIELDLTGNDPGQSGVKELDDLLQDQKCKLKTLRFLSHAAEEACKYLTEDLHIKNPLLLRELNLSKHELGDTRVNQIAALLQDKHCKLNALILSDCSITEEGYKALASALRSNPSHLIELDLTGNDPGQSGVKELNDLLQDQKCKLKTLRFLSPAADEACQFVNRVLGENLLLLRELNLSEHKLGPSGLKKLAAVLPDKHCKLNTLILSNSDITDEDCRVLTEALNSNPSNLTELNLSGTKLRDSGLKIFSALFKNEQCQLEKLKLYCSSITAEGCSVLASAFCLNLKELELHENKLGNSGVTEISTLLGNSQCTLKILRLSDCSITEEGYKALASALRSNPSHLIELDLTGNDPGQSGVKELNDLLQDQKCQLKTLRFLGPAADEACQFVRGIVGKNPLLLRELNLSGHKLGDTRVNQISALLQDKHCKLNTLILSDCSITEEGYKALASALRSNPSHLIELDLTGNDPGQSGVKELNDLLQDQKCQLKTLRFLGPAADEACWYVRGIVGKNPLLLRELNLSGHELGDTRVNQIAALLQDRHCTVNTLMLNNNSITAEGCAALTSAFNSNPSNLIELDLSGNKLGNSGIMKICHLLENTQCRLEKLKLSDCSISEEGFKTLTSSLRSNSNLIELDLTGNDPGRSGIKELIDLLRLECCKLKNIRFLKSPAAQEACEYLTKVLGKSPLLLTELDLSEDKLGDLDGEKLSALLMDSHCKVEKIKLNNCERTQKSCSVLATVLSSKTILKELNLNNSRLLDSGVKQICEGLKESTLKILRLSDCSITEEGYKALASALRSNPSHLIELDLTGNDPGQSGVKELIDLQSWWYSLKRLRTPLVFKFLDPAADEACQYLRSIVGQNPLLLRKLNLSGHELGDTRVKQITALLQDKHCKLNTLMLRDCGLTEESCSALATVLRSNSSLKELDISNNNQQDSGVKKLQNTLENTNCTLEKLSLSDCSISEEGYKALASALRSNPSHLIELDLTGNDPGQSGVKELNDLLQDQKCHLKTLRFLGSAADEACQYLTGIVGENPLLLRELNLSEHELVDRNVNQITALLKDKHCKLNTLMLNNNSITAEGCAALTSAFNSNPSNLIKLDLSGNKLGNSGMEKICLLLKNTQCRLERLKLRDCGLTEESCSALATVLRSNSSLKELDISNNNLQDSGVKKLQNALENTNCTLKKLRLSDCSITEEGYKALASALRSNPSHLIELDLNGNDPGQSGVKELSDLLQDQNCQLKTLRFLGPAADEACQYMRGIVGKNLLLLRELNLSGRKLGDTRVNQIAALLQDRHCKLNTLTLNNNSITAEGCAALTSAFNSNPSNLIELDLSGNKLGNSGIKKICPLLKNTQCRLMKLKLSDCSITEEGYKALASALRSNPSHLIELDLTGNDPGQSGVEYLINVQKTLCRSLKTLRILQSPAADEACQYVRGIVGKNPLFLSELNLSGCKLGDTRVNQIAALLKDKHCEINTLMLRDCGLTEESCSALTTVLISHSSLKELDISNNNLQDSGLKKLQNALENTNCTLEKLRLSDCSIREEGYKALASALRSNPSHLIELDLTGNDPGQSGVKELNDLLQDQNCQLKTLRFLRSPAAEEACKNLTELVGKNPLLLRELNLSGHELGDTRVNQITALLQDKHCTVNTLTLCGCSFTEKQCYTLTSALFPNLSHLRELNLSGNQLKNTGAKNISAVLKDSRCHLERLRLRGCDMTDKGCSAVASALRSNPSHLRELDLSGNKPGDSGFKDLSDLLMNPQCKLENLQLCKCNIKEKQCVFLTSALRSNPSHLRKLNFSGNQIENKGVEILCEVLKDSRCKLERLSLNECGITDVSSLTQSLTNTKALQFLKELDLSKNNIGSSRQKLIDLIQDSSCNLSLEEEGWISWNTAANVFSSIGGLFTWSKAQEDPVKSAAQEKPPSDERSSEGKLEEDDTQEYEFPV
ncbi:uncharacterized protein LOC125254758 isoform X2 [Megalobrama amblycephala]|uniref:uncharacterized protein LOC125254758 isoform X2 n=1 Tax=Megalobrama amblycephala TaxID=75352 RepID=UPI002014057A|nr:uncharacterized protein LOC125254758 isoform X2 [Megalobrama amblycephala]